VGKLVAGDENLMVIGMAEINVFEDLVGSGIYALTVIMDRRSVLVGRFDGVMIEVDVDTGCVVGDYGKLHGSTIYGIFWIEEQGIYEQESKKYAWSVGFDGSVQKVS
jgi:hypothetical protein